MVLEGVVCQQLIPGTDGNVVPAFEIMRVNNAVRNMIRESKLHQLDNVIAQSAASGMRTMDQDILRLVREGKVDAAEAIRYASNPEWLAARLRG